MLYFSSSRRQDVKQLTGLIVAVSSTPARRRDCQNDGTVRKLFACFHVLYGCTPAFNPSAGSVGTVRMIHEIFFVHTLDAHCGRLYPDVQPQRGGGAVRIFHIIFFAWLTSRASRRASTLARGRDCHNLPWNILRVLHSPS